MEVPETPILYPAEIISRLPQTLAAYQGLSVISARFRGITLDDYYEFGKAIGAIKPLIENLMAYIDGIQLRLIPFQPTDIIRFVKELDNGVQLAEQRAIVFEASLKQDLKELAYRALCKAAEEEQLRILNLLATISDLTTEKELRDFQFFVSNKNRVKSNFEAAFKCIGVPIPSDLEQSFGRFSCQVEDISQNISSRLKFYL